MNAFQFINKIYFTLLIIYNSVVSSASDQARERIQRIDLNYDSVRLKKQDIEHEQDDIDIYNPPYRNAGNIGLHFSG